MAISTSAAKETRIHCIDLNVTVCCLQHNRNGVEEVSSAKQ